MEVKIRYIIPWLFVLISGQLTCLDLYSQVTPSKPSRQAAMESFSKGDYEKALKEFDLLLKNYSKDPLYKYYSGVCLVKMNRDPENAAAFLKDAINGSLDIKSIPDDAWFYLGRSQQMMGRFTAAIDSYSHFKDKAGKKKSMEFDVNTYIQQCNYGQGRLTDTGSSGDKNVSKTTSEVISAGNKNETEKAPIRPVTQPVPQKKEVPKEYDILLSEAMKYQVKADSLNTLAAESRRELDNLPASRKEEARIRILEMEALAAEYQKIADAKFGNKTNQPAVLRNEAVNSKVPVKEEESELYSLFEVVKNNGDARELSVQIDPELPAGLIYRIQIGVFSKSPDPSFFKGLSPVSGFRISGTNAIRYFVGMFRKMTDASRALLTVKQMGFKDSFITAISDGKAVSIERASLLENEWGQQPFAVIAPVQRSAELVPSTLVFRVEISRSPKAVSNEVAENYKKIAGTREFEIVSTDAGSFVYLIGKFITFESASEYADLLKRNGYRESRVVAYLGSKEIPLETAKKLFEK